MTGVLGGAVGAPRDARHKGARGDGWERAKDDLMSEHHGENRLRAPQITASASVLTAATCVTPVTYVVAAAASCRDGGLTKGHDHGCG